MERKYSVWKVRLLIQEVNSVKTFIFNTLHGNNNFSSPGFSDSSGSSGSLGSSGSPGSNCSPGSPAVFLVFPGPVFLVLLYLLVLLVFLNRFS